MLVNVRPTSAEVGPESAKLDLMSAESGPSSEQSPQFPPSLGGPGRRKDTDFVTRCLSETRGAIQGGEPGAYPHTLPQLAILRGQVDPELVVRGLVDGYDVGLALGHILPQTRGLSVALELDPAMAPRRPEAAAGPDAARRRGMSKHLDLRCHGNRHTPRKW